MNVSTAAPLSHLSGRDYLAVWRGTQPEPPRPYSWDALGLTPNEYTELMYLAPPTTPRTPAALDDEDD